MEEGTFQPPAALSKAGEKQTVLFLALGVVLLEFGCCQRNATLLDAAETAIRQNENVSCPS